MNPKTSSPRDELPEPLRSIIEGIVSEPMPESLIPSAQAFRAKVSRKSRRSPGSFAAVLVSLLALGICVMALTFQEKPKEPKHQIVEEPQPAAPLKIQELPPPTLWAYRQAAQTPEALEALLTQHAAALLPAGEVVSLDPFSRKEL
jgi:hypothetical protein